MIMTVDNVRRYLPNIPVLSVVYDLDYKFVL